jgi:outer membrane receptor protein involved in Fe transport
MRRPLQCRVLRPIAAACMALAGGAARAEGSTFPLQSVEITAVGPQAGLGIPKSQVPAQVQTASAAALERRHALDLADFLNRALGSVHINAVQNNPFQPDVNFRGFAASPLLGTPQGLSVYMDGVRLNQPFGDVVSWDLIPRSALSRITLMPGSNPLFGLNALGGSLSVQTKDGRRNPGTSVQVSGGSHGRLATEFETGGSSASGLDWFVSGNRFHERGWRAGSPSEVRQLFGKFGAHDGQNDIALTLALARNELTGNGPQEQGALARDHGSVYTAPDQTRNRALFFNLQGTRQLGNGFALSGNGYFRRIVTPTTNGDVNDEALTQSLYQPDAAEQAALAAAGYTGFPASGADAANTPFPQWRCIANALRHSAPNETCDGLINRTDTRQKNFGLAGQLEGDLTLSGLGHHLLGGLAWDANRVVFSQSTQFGTIRPDRSIAPVAAFADGTQDSGNAFDARVALTSRSHTVSAFGSDTIALDPRTHLTVSGRYNRNTVSNVDGLRPGGGTGSLDGHHRFSRFNPALGLTFTPRSGLTFYAGANQGSRAPTAIELGCADPLSPCKLPNSFAGDPPLKQVVTTTAEAGARGLTRGGISWNVGVFRSDNRNDLLFVSDNASGYGYFKNFGQTRRQGVELGVSARPVAAWKVGANATFLDATYRTAETVGGSSNSSNDSAQAGFPGTDGRIQIRPGDRLPLLPRTVLKLFTDWDIDARWSLGADAQLSSGATARGNENGQHRPDGLYYTGPGRSAGYTVFNLNADFRPTSRIKLFVVVDNVFNRRYATAAQLGANGFDASGHVSAQALPRQANGDYPVRSGSFLAPGAPRTATVGLRYSFD